MPNYVICDECDKHIDTEAEVAYIYCGNCGCCLDHCQNHNGCTTPQGITQ